MSIINSLDWDEIKETYIRATEKNNAAGIIVHPNGAREETNEFPAPVDVSLFCRDGQGSWFYDAHEIDDEEFCDIDGAMCRIVSNGVNVGKYGLKQAAHIVGLDEGSPVFLGLHRVEDDEAKAQFFIFLAV